MTTENHALYVVMFLGFFLYTCKCLLEIGVVDTRERESERESVHMYIIHFYGRVLKKQSSSSGGKVSENSEWSSSKERLCNCHREAYR